MTSGDGSATREWRGRVLDANAYWAWCYLWLPRSQGFATHENQKYSTAPAGKERALPDRIPAVFRRADPVGG